MVMTDALNLIFLIAGFCIIALIIMVVVIIMKVERLHLAINSRLDELLRTTGSLARAEGFRAGQENHLAEAKRASDALTEIERGRRSTSSGR
jgi:hypothetical protein